MTLDGSGDCVCAAGQYFVAASTSCLDCAPGSFLETVGRNTTCAPCSSVGQYRTTNSLSGRTSAADCVCLSSFLELEGNCVCPPGKFLDVVSSRCTDCPPNTFLEIFNLNTSCISCTTIGEFRETRGAIASNSSAACVCPATLVLNEATNECVCSEGYFYQPFQRECRICPADTYLSGLSANTRCNACGTHRTTNNVQGRTQASDCLCATGFYPSADGSECLDCSALGETASCGGANSYSALGSSNLTAIEAAGISVKVGYWLTTDSTFLEKRASTVPWFDIVKCPVRDGCPGGAVEENCADGYTGPACGICASGFGKLGQQCAQCPSAGASAFLVFLIVALVVAGCYAVIRLSQDSNADADNTHTIGLKIAITHMQIIGFTGNFASQWPDVLIRVFAIPASAATISSASDNIATDCATHPTLYTRGIVIFFLPLILGAGVALGYAVLGAVRGDFSQLPAQVKRGTLVLLYVAHPGIVQGVLKLMVCYDVGTQSYALSDMSVSCTEPGFQTLRAIGAVYLVLYGFGGLGVVYWLMQRDKEDFTFMTQGYREEMYFWDLVVTTRKMVFVVVALFASAPLQLFFGLWILLLSWIAHQFLHPYRDETPSRMESASLWVLLITVSTGMLFYTAALSTDQTDGAIVSVLLIILNFAAVLAFLLTTARKGASNWRAKRKSEAPLSPL
eukprot:TRINITY_DN60_c2_g1_i1.p1 TRINITY_DN60_c2_g1~~TRINITY_DN60_c2_g1_i1.p1  ORF type:complete len:754 (-),score=190.15 TRINITY_DN60_c2_g1_i1:21-2063(-)